MVFFKKIHNAIKVWVTLILMKKILVPILLILIYFFILGPTSVLVRIFFRKQVAESKSNINSAWSEAKNFDETLESAVSQS